MFKLMFSCGTGSVFRVRSKLRIYLQFESDVSERSAWCFWTRLQDCLLCFQRFQKIRLSCMLLVWIWRTVPFNIVFIFWLLLSNFKDHIDLWFAGKWTPDSSSSLWPCFEAWKNIQSLISWLQNTDMYIGDHQVLDVSGWICVFYPLSWLLSSSFKHL